MSGVVRPFWSVVIPLYNKQDFIEATLQSVLTQTGGPDLEVVVVDDGSRDDGATRVQAVSDPRVRLVRQANAGVAAARNRGIRESRGQWVAFLDADDLWHPRALMALRQLAAEFPHAQVLGGAFVRVPGPDVAGYRFAPHELRPANRKISDLPGEFLARGLPFYTSSVAVRRAELDTMSTWFPEGESMGEDLDLWFRLAEQMEVACTSSVVALYRTELSGSLMGQYKNLVLLPVWRRLRERANTQALPAGLRRSSLRLAAEMEVTLARRFAKAGKRAEALPHLLAARSAMRGHRWWVTLLALVLLPTSHLSRLR